MVIAVCVCTYQRPALLRELLGGLARLQTDGHFTYSVTVADNDASESARELVMDLARDFPVPLRYCAEPRRSISHVRNRVIMESSSDLIAFIDDDERPDPRWLQHLHDALVRTPCAGVLGPVRPHYPPGTPDWVIKAGFFERPEHPTGHLMAWPGCRTGNVLFKRAIISGLAEPFRPEFGSGGGDVDFFRRMTEAGHRFIWCNEAVVWETVPPSRWKRGVLLKRALLRGRNSYRHESGRMVNLAKALVAIPLYAVALPFLFFFGHHWFMRYLSKWCDHAGRLLAALGIDPVRVREM